MPPRCRQCASSSNVVMPRISSPGCTTDNDFQRLCHCMKRDGARMWYFNACSEAAHELINARIQVRVFAAHWGAFLETLGLSGRLIHPNPLPREEPSC